MDSSFFIDIGSHQTQKNGEDCFGDTIYAKKIPEEQRIIGILSDGLGSGVKANILSSMTTRMAMKFMENNTDLQRASETMMDALPICQVRKISYATFSIVDSELEGKTRIFEMDNPRYIFIRNNRLFDIKGREFSSPKWKERKVFVSQVNNLPEDRIIFMSDTYNIDFK